MRLWIMLAAALVAAGAAPEPVRAQRIVEVPASETDAVKPEDLYSLPPGRWHLARHLWQGSEPCTATQCEAGYTAGDLVVSAERDGPSVTITAAWRGCASPAFSTLDIGENASKGERKKIAKQVQRVLKGLGKTCEAELPEVAPMTGDWLYPVAETGGAAAGTS